MAGQGPRVGAAARRESLTQRETEVLRYLPSRLSNAEIAEHLGISENTLKTHLKGLYRKLGVQTRNTAIDAAVAGGLLSGGRSLGP